MCLAGFLPVRRQGPTSQLRRKGTLSATSSISSSRCRIRSSLSASVAQTAAISTSARIVGFGSSAAARQTLAQTARATAPRATSGTRVSMRASMRTSALKTAPGMATGTPVPAWIFRSWAAARAMPVVTMTAVRPRTCWQQSCRATQQVQRYSHSTRSCQPRQRRGQ